MSRHTDSREPLEAVVILGTGGMGREARQWLTDAGIRVRGFLDDNPERQGATVAGLPMLGSSAWASDHPDVPIVVAIGDAQARRLATHRLQAIGARLTGFIHPSVTVGEPAEFGDGVMGCPGSIISVDTRIGDGVLINDHAVVGHDAVIGAFVSLAPGCKVLGAVTVGEGTTIGTNAVLMPGVTIGRDSVVCAGAVVSKDVADGLVVAGSPARVVRRTDV